MYVIDYKFGYLTFMDPLMAESKGKSTTDEYIAISKLVILRICSLFINIYAIIMIPA
jgi:hypothetical protein